MRIFVPSKAEDGERFGARPVMLCSEAAENDGTGVTEAAEEVRGAEVELEPLVEALKDRASVEVLVGR